MPHTVSNPNTAIKFQLNLFRLVTALDCGTPIDRETERLLELLDRHSNGELC
jgi:hypothetical protein